jgi:hypothetical protein
VICISYTPSSPSLAILGERYAPQISRNSITVTARKLAQRRLDRSVFGTLKKTAASALAHGFFFFDSARASPKGLLASPTVSVMIQNVSETRCHVLQPWVARRVW